MQESIIASKTQSGTDSGTDNELLMYKFQVKLKKKASQYSQYDPELILTIFQREYQELF